MILLDRLLSLAVGLALLLSASEARAEAYCSAVPQEVLAQSDGFVVVLTPYRGWIGVCNLKSLWKGIDPQICVSWFATVSNAVVQRKALGLYYVGLSQSDCASMGVWGDSPAPLYVRISG